LAYKLFVKRSTYEKCLLYLQNNKNSKMKIKLTLLAMLMFVGIVGAQAQQGQRRTPEERLTDSLKISAAQQTDVSAAYLEFYNAQDKLRAGLAPGTRPERADMDKLTEARDAKLKIILKEDQYNKLKEMEAAMRNRQRPPGQ
jgi:hypothetical protein